MRFNAPTDDQERLSSLLERVKALMSDGNARTLAQIAQKTGGTESSVSARLRDLRKERFEPSSRLNWVIEKLLHTNHAERLSIERNPPHKIVH